MESRLPRIACVCLLLLAPSLLLLAGCGDDEVAAPVKIDGRTRAEWETALAGTTATDQADALRALAKAEEPPIEIFVEHLKAPDAAVRAAAIRALGVAGPEAAAHAPTLALYLEEDAEGFEKKDCRTIRNAAIYTLGKIGPEAFSFMAHLLVHQEAKYRARVAYTIRPFVAEMEDGTKVLLPLVEDENAIVRREAVRGLALSGKGDERACQALLLALKDNDADVVRYAAMAIGGIGGRSDREGKALADLLYAHQTAIRTAAVYGLGLMGEEASPHTRQVLDLLKNDSRRHVRIQAARAHWLITGEAGPALAELQQDIVCEDVGLCRDALKALALLGSEAEPAVPVLAKMLSKRQLRHHVILVLTAIGPPAQAAVPSLEKVAANLGAKDEALGQEIAEALAAIGKAG